MSRAQFKDLIMVGCLDLNDQSVESAATVVARIKRALQYIPASQVILAPEAAGC